LIDSILVSYTSILNVHLTQKLESRPLDILTVDVIITVCRNERVCATVTVLRCC